MKFLKKINIRAKIFLFAILTLIFVVFNGVIGYQALDQSITSADKLTKVAYPRVLLVQKFKSDSHALMRFLWTTHGLYQYASERKNQITEAKESFRSMQEDMQLILKNEFSPEIKKIVKEINDRWTDLSVTIPKIISSYESGTEEANKEATNSLAFEAVAQANEINEYLKEFDVKLQSEIHAETKLNAEKSTSLKKVISGSMAVSVVILILVSFIFANALSKKLMMVAGDLRNTAGSTEKSSSDLNRAASAVGESSQEQASAIQETASTLDEFSSMLQMSSRNAQQSMDWSLKSKEAADDGKEIVKKVVESIQDIKLSNDEVLNKTTEGNQRIKEIVYVINEISEKTKVINDIVFQTKLLSFNASVEAARAGEQGKGFAVVAEEVGNLAVMSGKAAQEIFEMLEASVVKVQDIVSLTQAEIEKLMQLSSGKIERGIVIAGDCDLALDNISNNIDSMNGLINEVVSAAKEQELGVQQITQAMGEIQKGTNFNTVTSKETLDYAESLTMQSKELLRIVSELETEIYGLK